LILIFATTFSTTKFTTTFCSSALLGAIAGNLTLFFTQCIWKSRDVKWIAKSIIALEEPKPMTSLSNANDNDNEDVHAWAQTHGINLILDDKNNANAVAPPADLDDKEDYDAINEDDNDGTAIMQPMPATQAKMLCAMQITTTFYNPVATNYIYMLPAMMIPLQQAINWEGNKQMQLTLTQMTMILTQVKKTCPSGRCVVRPSICCNQLIAKLCLLFLQPTPKVNQSSWTFKMNLSTTQSSPQCSRKPTTMKIWNNVPSRMQPSTKSSRT